MENGHYLKSEDLRAARTILVNGVRIAEASAPFLAVLNCMLNQLYQPSTVFPLQGGMR